MSILNSFGLDILLKACSTLNTFSASWGLMEPLPGSMSCTAMAAGELRTIKPQLQRYQSVDQAFGKMSSPKESCSSTPSHAGRALLLMFDSSVSLLPVHVRTAPEDRIKGTKPVSLRIFLQQWLKEQRAGTALDHTFLRSYAL